mmetsp:Transcript_118879/g.332903  ORF Transcript_118879/g.332903 Transcript_118879/m.332903 type:complete len:200 (+) Transcript_118879:211-810(+)
MLAQLVRLVLSGRFETFFSCTKACSPATSANSSARLTPLTLFVGICLALSCSRACPPSRTRCGTPVRRSRRWTGATRTPPRVRRKPPHSRCRHLAGRPWEAPPPSKKSSAASTASKFPPWTSRRSSRAPTRRRPPLSASRRTCARSSSASGAPLKRAVSAMRRPRAVVRSASRASRSRVLSARAPTHPMRGIVSLGAVS